MTRITQKLPNGEGVSAGSTATFRIPVGRRFHALYLNYNDTNQDVSDFEEIRIFCNGQVIQRFTGTERDTLNQFEGKAAAAGTLEIPFDRVGLLTRANQEVTAINTGVADSEGRKITSMYMEIDVASGATISVSDLTLYSEESDAIAGGPGVIPYIRREQRNPSGASSDFQISDLVNPGVNAPDKISLARVTFVPSTGTLANIKISRNNYDIFDRTDALNRVVQNANVRTAVAGYYMIDTGEKGHGGMAISLYGMTDFRYKLDVSAAMTLTCLSEYLGVLIN